MRKILIVLIIVIALVIPITALAASPDTKAESNISNISNLNNSAALNDQQKADLKASIDKMLELHKEAIDKQVQSGSITKGQGDQQLQTIENMMSPNTSLSMMNGYSYGSGMMNGYNYGSGIMNGYNYGSGMMNGFANMR